MGKLERINKLRFGRDEILFVVLSILLYFLSSRLPKSILAEVCLGASIAVKVVGLPDQLRKMAKNGDVSSQSLLRNVIDYQSYVLWALYAQAIHSPVLFWGQFPGALLVWLITLFHLRKGDFPWRRKLNKFGHLNGANCWHCAYIDLKGRQLMDPASPEYYRDSREFSASPYVSKADIPAGESEWPRRCSVEGCPGWWHPVKAYARWSGALRGRPVPMRPGIIVECDTCDHHSYHFEGLQPPREGECNCWYHARDPARIEVTEELPVDTPRRVARAPLRAALYW